jgi:spermidine/putrescine transport system ATP-binding protein
LEKNTNINIIDIHKNYNKVEVLKGINLEIKNEFFTLLGSSGCGKSTLLNIIAGLDCQDRGDIILNGNNINYIPANKRSINTVFQNYALFPHIPVYKNIAFGLLARKIKKDVAYKKVKDFMDLLFISELWERYPEELSGGQQQRVALARAIINEPDILLLDEPMSALDAQLRKYLQEELKALQKKINTTFILVTHDQEEAMTCSDRIGIMKDGLMVQVDTPRNLYNNPVNKFVASFIGLNNIFDGKKIENKIETPVGLLNVQPEPEWEEGSISIRPEKIQLCESSQNDNNRIRGKIQSVIFKGGFYDLFIKPEISTIDNFLIRVRSYLSTKFNDNENIGLFFPPPELIALN